jgi:hypothetical protein
MKKIKLISNHNWGMLEDIPVINTSAIDNPFCLSMSKKENVICSYCYSLKTTIPKNPNNVRCRRKWKEIGELFSQEILSYKDIPYVPKFRDNNKLSPIFFVRLNSQGELINETHYINYIKLCRKNLYTDFILYTKRIDIISKFGKKEIPKTHHLYDRLREVENLILIYSQPKINKILQFIPEHFDKIFIVFTEDYAEKNNILINCEHKCLKCHKCYYKNNGITQINDILKGTKINWDEYNQILSSSNYNL